MSNPLIWRTHNLVPSSPCLGERTRSLCHETHRAEWVSSCSYIGLTSFSFFRRALATPSLVEGEVASETPDGHLGLLAQGHRDSLPIGTGEDLDRSDLELHPLVLTHLYPFHVIDTSRSGAMHQDPGLLVVARPSVSGSPCCVRGDSPHLPHPSKRKERTEGPHSNRCPC